MDFKDYLADTFLATGIHLYSLSHAKTSLLECINSYYVN
jgi:hypothetical protein